MSRRLPIPSAKLPAPGGRSLLFYAQRSIVLFNIDGELYAIDDSCPHAGASLFSGTLQGRWLQCPAHGLRFDLASGCMANAKGFGVVRHRIEHQPLGAFIVISDTPIEEPIP
ncbi:Rieske (2Fe-2S) protein [Pseudomonas panipatensis]|uniref:Ferredoxin subunit of nitrite reductase or a ring-hydroxylating dioxygenase n=1 Tax=Pseudomonas panipatensis TaxID=428992 RepID=A0A1G8I4L0_9PSED|nr:Rieske 2Fe-2S domain-containing protein [Pseudomonas panipatensis]SDI13879.1 Ferredoxin subunit of nitrite reductase or a ring-hydroxylating dioxygenase [Pseudomonas panipatensis]SMP76141.1 Ferredoxin subunit of nitrite reductase or a ring-hydroxylating dioxygenase [Pseudomonas panipatensis]